MLGKREWNDPKNDRALPEGLNGGLGQRRLDGSEIAVGFMMDAYERDMLNMVRNIQQVDDGVPFTMKTFSELIAKNPMILPMMVQQALTSIEDPLSNHFPTEYIDTDHWKASSIRFDSHQVEISALNTVPRVNTYTMSQKSGHLDFFMLGFLVSRRALMTPQGEMIFKALLKQLRVNFFLGTITEIAKSIFNATEYYAQPHLRYGREGVIPTSVVAVMAHRRRRHGAYTRYSNAVQTGIDNADAVMGQESANLPSGILMSSEMRHFLTFGRDRLLFITAGNKLSNNVREILVGVKVKNRTVKVIVSPEVKNDEDAQFGCDPWLKSPVAVGGFAAFKNVAFGMTDPSEYTTAKSNIQVPDAVTNDFAEYSLLRCIETCPWFIGRKEDFPVHANLTKGMGYEEGHLDKKMLKALAERLMGKDQRGHEGRLYDVNTRTDYTTCPDSVDVFLRFGWDSKDEKWKYHIVERIGEMAVSGLPNEHLLFMAKCLENNNEEAKKRLEKLALAPSSSSSTEIKKLENEIIGEKGMLKSIETQIEIMKERKKKTFGVRSSGKEKVKVDLKTITTFEQLYNYFKNVETTRFKNLYRSNGHYLNTSSSPFTDIFKDNDTIEQLVNYFASTEANAFFKANPSYATSDAVIDFEISTFEIYMTENKNDFVDVKIETREALDTDDAENVFQRNNTDSRTNFSNAVKKASEKIHPALNLLFIATSNNDFRNYDSTAKVFVKFTPSELPENLKNAQKAWEDGQKELIERYENDYNEQEAKIEELRKKIVALSKKTSSGVSFSLPDAYKRTAFLSTLSGDLKNTFELITNLPITLDVFSILAHAHVPLPFLGMLLEDSQTQIMSSATYLADNIGKHIVHRKGLMESVIYYPEPEDKYKFQGAIMFSAAVMKEQGVYVQENAFGGPILGGFGNRFINQRDNNTFISHLHNDFNTVVLPRVAHGIVQKEYSKIFVPSPIVSPNPDVKVFSTTGYYDPQKFCLEMQVQGAADFQDTQAPHYVSQAVANQIYKIYMHHPRNGVVYSSISPQMRKTLALTNSVVCLMPTRHYSSMTNRYEINRSHHVWGRFGRNVRQFMESKLHTSSIVYTQEEAYHNPEDEFTLPH